MQMCFAPVVLLHLKRFAPAAAIILFGRAGEVVLFAIDGCFVHVTGSAWQVQVFQLCLVIVEELCQSSDLDVILAAHNGYLCICDHSDK